VIELLSSRKQPEPMQSYSSKEELREQLNSVRQGKRIVLVPTMGALHEGHKNLLVEARKMAEETGIVVASIFVNPIQFDNTNDLATYPRTLDSDLAICQNAGVDYVFTPTPEIMYSPDRSIAIEENSLSTKLCGASRPGHFTGVCTVVAKLFNIVQPTDAIFGKKDFQQLAIIRRMVRDLDIPVTIHGVEIVRADNGLAFSSRNARLTPDQKKAAPVLRKLLLQARNEYSAGESLDTIRRNALETIASVPNTQVDYIEIVHAETMQSLDNNDHSSPALMALAVFFGDVRLIDNIEL
jgi:pantoate--beta-alanine ligase